MHFIWTFILICKIRGLDKVSYDDCGILYFKITYCLQCTPKSSILLSGIVWYSEGPSSGGL